MRIDLLNAMVNYNEKTITSMGMHLVRKIGVPGTSELFCIEWNHNTDFIVVGGAMGTLKIIKIEDNFKGVNSLSVNQALEGHSSSVMCASWNEIYQKLTTSDAAGLIIVWGQHNDSWFEEMINNRNKSIVVGMGWNCEGNKIAIAYADGQVIVGTLEGNRIWNKDLPNVLCACEWAPDGNSIFFGTQEGELHVYDGQGNFVQKVHLIGMDSMELRTALESELVIPKNEDSNEIKRKPDPIICIRWYIPPMRSKVKKTDGPKAPNNAINNEPFTKAATRMFSDPTTFHPSNNVPGEPDDSVAAPRISRMTASDPPPTEMMQQIIPDKPRLLIAFTHGVIQLMRNELDTSPIIVRFPKYKITCARWSPNGAFVAVTGYKTDEPPLEQCFIHVITAYGQIISNSRIRDTTTLTGFAWDKTGLKFSISADAFCCFGCIRPQYKWGYIGHTVIYIYEKEEKNTFAVNFYETKLEELFVKTINRFQNIGCHENYCILVNEQVEEEKRTYFAQLCNGIGTALDFKHTEVEPRCVALNGYAAVIAGGQQYFIWHFVLPKYNSVQTGIHVPGKEGVYNLEENNSGPRRGYGRTADSICALSMADKYFYAACDSGALYKIELNDGNILQRLSIAPNLDSIKLNCTFTRLATLDKNLVLTIYDFKDNSVVEWKKLEQREVWNYIWDAEKEDMLAMNEKVKMVVLKGNSFEEPVNTSGYLCSFKGLIVKTVAIEKFLLRPEAPDKKHLHDIETKALRDVKLLLERMKIDEATEFIEKNPHPRLWRLLAEVALNKLDVATAEHAYVKLRDYSGITFCKKLLNIQNGEIQRAEVFSHLSKFDKAEKIFLQNDRRDLAIAMYTKINDWKHVLQLLTADDDDSVRQTALKNVGDSLYDHMKYQEAAMVYKQADCLEQRINSLIKSNLFGELEELARNLPDNHRLLEKIGDAFTSRGLCDQAVECYMKCGLVKKALAACIELNFWERANAIAKSNNLADVDVMLSKYAEELIGPSNERSMSALQLYRRAGRLMDAAKICFEIAKDETIRMAPYTRLKRIYVMGALLIEEMHVQRNKGREKPSAARVLEDTLNEEMEVSIEESRVIENAWRGAEAFHLICVAHQHFYEERPSDALRTAIILTEYEDILDVNEIYSMMALAAANVRQFSLCSKAMMKLEVCEMSTEDEKEMMRDLSLEMFNMFPPTESQVSKLQCPSCEAYIKEYDTTCGSCFTKFPVCIATGRPLLELQFWICLTCKHRAYQKEITKFRTCPLCHSSTSFL
ncbi:unnamed protein product [Caenorhabditis angaria]|uniref:Anaphase-promoting complex subunit 4 WD40 domain-containing protein n=1 Tax=Caenorhabditis angaria TaxID=860376 RepID=A0A9P1J5Z1_9PELO|nr:unnamed protein product [Caenorhabditis angaria]